MAKKIGKNIENMRKLVDDNKFYELADAIKLAKKASYSKFDGSIDVALKLNLDVRKAEQQLRGSVSLPHGNGKTIKILAAVDTPKLAEECKKAKADIICNTEDLTQILQKGKFDFDVIVAEPKMMPLLGRFGKLLGPKGLMPNPKVGTVSPNPAKVVEDIKKGKANYRTDKNGIVHVLAGKVSFTDKKLEDNIKVILDTITRLKPSAVKGKYIQNFTISATMGPSVKIKLS
jgi:large subunit ribosomal protein L1